MARVWAQRCSNGTVSLNVAVFKDDDTGTKFRIAATNDRGEVAVTSTGLYGVHLHFREAVGGGALDLPRFYLREGARRQGYGALIVMVVRALAFPHNGREPLLKSAGAPSVNRLTVTPRPDAVGFYKKMGFKDLCGAFTWFPRYPLNFTRLRFEPYLSASLQHQPVRTHVRTYTHAHTLPHV